MAKTRDQREAEWAEHFKADFLRDIATGADRRLPIYSQHGPARFAPVSEFLGECHKAAQALLLEACTAAANGEATSACLLLTRFAAEVAGEYGVTTAEAASLIADPDEDEREHSEAMARVQQFTRATA